MISCKLGVWTIKQSKYFEAKRKTSLPEVSVANYNTDFSLFVANYDLWSLLNRFQQRYKNLSVLGSKEAIGSLMQLKIFFVQGRYIFDTFNANNMIGKVSFSNCDHWFLSNLHTSKN